MDGYNKGYGVIAVFPTASLTRPADTNPYASGDLIAQSTTAASCTPMTFSSVARFPSGSFQVRRARIRKTSTVTTNATFRLHLYANSPTIQSGDNAAWATSESGWYGRIDVTVDEVFTTNAKGAGGPTSNELNCVAAPGAVDIYGVLEARGAYTPITNEVLTVELEVWQN